MSFIKWLEILFEIPEVTLDCKKSKYTEKYLVRTLITTSATIDQKCIE